MGRYSKSPPLFEDMRRISITRLKKLGFLSPCIYMRNTLAWTQNGMITKEVSIITSINSNNSYIELNYAIGKEIQSYKVQIVSLPSNLGKGRIQYFLCPQSGKCCRILYLVGKRFIHRDEAKGYYYKKQTYSSSGRSIIKIFEYLDACDLTERKYYKKFHMGRPTKKYAKFISEMDKFERQSVGILNNLK
jgi:hypothetical protein